MKTGFYSITGRRYANMKPEIYYEKNVPHCKYFIVDKHDGGWVTVYPCNDKAEITYVAKFKMRMEQLALYKPQ